MNLFKFESVGFIISLGITLLLCGLIMFYVRQRFAAYDRHLIEQSQLLKHLVSSIQSNARPTSELAAPSAIKAAEKVFSKSEEKIVVSDDEVDSETDEDSETESTSDTSDDGSNEENEKKESCCDSLGKCPVSTNFPFGNMLTLLVNKKMKNEDNDSDKDSDDEDDESDSDNDSDTKSLNSLNDFVERTEEIKHIDFSPRLDGIKVLGEDDISDKLNIQSLDVSNTEISLPSKLNLDEIHVKKLDDIIGEDESETLENKQVSNLKDLSKKALQDLCKERNLPLNGTRGELIKRLSQ